jgi:hypothetical protein
VKNRKTGECVSKTAAKASPAPKAASPKKPTYKKQKGPTDGIPELTREQEMDANHKFLKMFIAKLRSAGHYEHHYSKGTQDEMNEILAHEYTLKESTQDNLIGTIEHIRMLHSMDDVETIDEFIEDCATDVQKKMSYYDNLSSRFPRLADAANRFLYKYGDTTMMPWDSRNIHSMNRAGNNNGKFDYKKLIEYMKRN